MKRALARQLGAEFVVDSSGAAWPGEVRRITGKRGVDLVVEHVGGAVLPQVFNCLARGGTVVTCGATAGREVSLDLWPFFVKQQRLIGSYSRDNSDLKATLAWAAAGKLKPVIDTTFPLASAGEAFTLKNAVQPRMNTDGHGYQMLAENSSLTPRVSQTRIPKSVFIRVHPWFMNRRPNFNCWI